MSKKLLWKATIIDVHVDKLNLAESKDYFRMKWYVI